MTCSIWHKIGLHVAHRDREQGCGRVHVHCMFWWASPPSYYNQRPQRDIWFACISSFISSIMLQSYSLHMDMEIVCTVCCYDFHAPTSQRCEISKLLLWLIHFKGEKHERMNGETNINPPPPHSPFLSHSAHPKIPSNTPMAIMNCWELYLTLVVWSFPIIPRRL